MIHKNKSLNSQVCPKCYSDQSSLDLGNEVSLNGNLQMSVPKKPSLALDLSFSKLKRSLQYFSSFTKNYQEEESYEEYLDDLTEDYSTYFTGYEPLSTVYMKKSQSHVEMKQKSSQTSFLQLSCSKNDVNIQTDTPNASFYTSQRKQEASKEKLKESTKIKPVSLYLYRLDESQRKNGYVQNPTLKRLFRSNSDKTLESSSIFSNKLEDPFVSAVNRKFSQKDFSFI